MQFNNSGGQESTSQEHDRLVSYPAKANLCFKISLTEQGLRRAVFLVNGFSLILLLAGLFSILAAQQVYETSIGADDDLLAEAIEGFHQRRIPIWFVPAQLFRILCALVGISESRMVRTISEDCNRSIVMIGIAAASFAFDLGLSMTYSRLDKATLSLFGLLPHLFLLEIVHKRQRIASITIEEKHRHYDMV